jgi:hypothetical protein
MGELDPLHAALGLILEVLNVGLWRLFDFFFFLTEAQWLVPSRE